MAVVFPNAPANHCMSTLTSNTLPLYSPLRALFPFRVIFGKITGISHINVIFTPFYDRSPALGGEFMGLCGECASTLPGILRPCDAVLTSMRTQNMFPTTQTRYWRPHPTCNRGDPLRLLSDPRCCKWTLTAHAPAVTYMESAGVFFDRNLPSIVF